MCVLFALIKPPFYRTRRGTHTQRQEERNKSNIKKKKERKKGTSL